MRFLGYFVGLPTLEIGIGICIGSFFYDQFTLLLGLVATFPLLTKIVLKQLLIILWLIGLRKRFKNAVLSFCIDWPILCTFELDSDFIILLF